MSNFVPNKEYLQGILLHYFIQKKSASEAHRILVETYGDHALSETTCRDWFKRLKNEHSDVEDMERSGPPKKFDDEELKALLHEVSCQTLAELAEYMPSKARASKSTTAPLRNSPESGVGPVAAVSQLDSELRLLSFHEGCVYAGCDEVWNESSPARRSRLEGAWLATILSSDEALAVACGIRSRSVLEEIVAALVRRCPAQVGQARARVILTTMKLRTDLSFAALAELFGCDGVVACRGLFVMTVRNLATVLRSMFRWSPGRAEDAPESFRGFENTVVALSRVRLVLRRPRCSDCRARTWCPAERRFAAKIITGVTPAGALVYASDLHAVGATDSGIFERSELAWRVTRGRAIMFDSGFSGVEAICRKRGICIYAPLDAGNKLLTKQEASFNRRLACARAHVALANRRIRRFALLKRQISWTLVPHLEHIVVVCCALANLETDPSHELIRAESTVFR